MNRPVFVSALALLSLCACGTELKLGSTFGLTPIKGETPITLARQTACETQDCKVTFSRAVVIATKFDYSKLDDLGRLLKAIDIDVRQLMIMDDDTDLELKPLERLSAATITIANELTLSRDDLARLPQTLRIEGLALEEVREQIKAGDPITISVKSELTVKPPLPRHLLVKYDVQPILVLGAR